MTTYPIIHETRHTHDWLGKPMTIVMCESVANDIAVYEHGGHVSGDVAAAHGLKWTERNTDAYGFVLPAGKHYRR